MQNTDHYPCYVKILANAEANDLLEIPSESDGTILMTTLQAQFANCTGLRFKSDSGAWRGVRLTDNALHPPEDGWGMKEFVITMPNVVKRKMDDDDCEPKAKRKDPLVKDLVVLALPWEVTEADLNKYFSKMGELEKCELKKHPNGKSKGFGFIRFKNKEDAKKTLSLNHNVGGKKVEISIAEKKGQQGGGEPIKLFVGRLKEGTTEDDLSEHFAPYGELTDVFLPQTFRGFGFVSFESADAARSVLDASHIINSQTVNVTLAVPKGGGQQQNVYMQQQNMQQGNYGGGYGYYGNNYNNYNSGYNQGYSNFGPYGGQSY